MFGNSAIADAALLKSVQRRLERTGMKTKLQATVRQGMVTLTGQLQYEKQRLSTVQAINGVSGVRQVIDRLSSPPKAKGGPKYGGGGYGTTLPAAADVTAVPKQEMNEHSGDGGAAAEESEAAELEGGGQDATE